MTQEQQLKKQGNPKQITHLESKKSSTSQSPLNRSKSPSQVRASKAPPKKMSQHQKQFSTDIKQTPQDSVSAYHYSSNYKVPDTLSPASSSLSKQNREDKFINQSKDHTKSGEIHHN